MNDSIWFIKYDILNENQKTYLDWFHKQHIPEKLSRKGYNWAAHFKEFDEKIYNKKNTTKKKNFLALFGASNSKVFLDPSPTQLKKTQDKKTKFMVKFRYDSLSGIIVHEWSSKNFNKIDIDECDEINVFYIKNETIDNELIGSWIIQKFAKTLTNNSDFLNFHKFFSVSGPYPHIIIQTFKKYGAKNNDNNFIIKTIRNFEDQSERNIKILCKKFIKIWP